MNEQCRQIFRNYKKLLTVKQKLVEKSKVQVEKLFDKQLVQQMADFMTRSAKKLFS